MSRPEVSVVTSVFNGERYLRRSVESVLSQADVDLEFIVVDDGSTDDTPAILREYAASDQRLRIVAQRNTGLTGALIRGCVEARGDVIARHDADDLSLPCRLREQVDRLRDDASLAMVSCRSRAVGPEGESLWETQQDDDPDRATELLMERWRGPAGHGTVMFRKALYDAVGGYRWQFHFAQDADLWLRLGELGRLTYVPHVLYAFRVSETGTSSSHRTMQHRLGALAHDCQAARRQGLSEAALLQQASRIVPSEAEAQRAAADGAYFIGRCLLRQRDARARRYFRRAVQRQPWKVKAWVGLALAYLATD